MEHEDEFLNTFFTHLSHLCFDKAKEVVEREKEACRSVSPVPWGILLSQLPQILLAEKSYVELGCLTIRTKGFLRKENSLRAIFEGLRLEMKRMEDSTKLNQSMDGSLQEEKPLSGCIAEYLMARIDLIDLYEKLFQLGSSKNHKYINVVQQIETIKQKHESKFSHFSLVPMKAVITLEVEILSYLLEAMDKLQKLEFIPSISRLYAAHTRLTVWENILQNRESWKLGIGTSFFKNNPQPLLFQWLLKLKSSVLSKLSLYFHTTLSLQTTSQEMRQYCAKQNVDYYAKLQTFQRRYDALLVALILDNRGYENQDNAFSVVVCFPTKTITPFLDSFTKLILEKTLDVTIADKHVFLYNSDENQTFTVANIETRINILLVFDGKKTEKDVHISNFITDITGQLRFVKNFLNLKTSSK